MSQPPKCKAAKHHICSLLYSQKRASVKQKAMTSPKAPAQMLALAPNQRKTRLSLSSVQVSVGGRFSDKVAPVAEAASRATSPVGERGRSDGPVLTPTRRLASHAHRE